MAATGTSFGSAIRPTCIAVVVAALWSLLSISSSFALIDIYRMDNNIPIGSYPGWTGGDPGWYNVASSGRNFTYLGDSWVIGARHVGVAPARFLGTEYALIPNQTYFVQNPEDWGIDLSTDSDLMLFRIKGAPALPDLTISSEAPPEGGEVVFIGRGSGRSTNEWHWSVNDSDPENWIWTEETDPEDADLHGYKASGAQVKRWGTNTIVSDQTWFDPEADPQVNGDEDADNNHVISVGSRHAITLTTMLDESGGTSHEVQAVPGNSGSAVFYKRDGNWELSGVVNAAFVYPDQYEDCLCSSAVYGNGIAFTDLAAYYDEIYDIIDSHANYSVTGDLNLDGVVSGNGTGPAATDDVTAFMDGWLNEQAEHDITTWQKGDLNLDGKTSLADFLLMRDALSLSGNGAGAAALAGFFGGEIATVPEPSSAALLLLAGAWLVRGIRRRSATAAD